MREKKCVSEGKRVWNTGAAVFSTRQLSFPCVPCLRAEDRLSFRARQPLREKQGDPEGNTAPTRRLHQGSHLRQGAHCRQQAGRVDGR